MTPRHTIRLFNGTDLEAFEPVLTGEGHGDPADVFRIEQVDGAPAIRISGEGFGGLLTTASYADYRLVVEYRWGESTWGSRADAARDSGVLLHCRGEPGNFAKDFSSPWMQSIELQIIEGGVGDILLLAGWDRDGKPQPTSLVVRTGSDRDGESVFDREARRRRHVATSGARRINWWGRDPDWKDVLGVRGPEELDSPHGEWTRLEAVCRGGNVRFLVNGKLANEGFDSNLTSGRLLFQCEGAEIFFRRIDLEPLEGAGASAAARARVFRAGAAAVDVTPETLPIRVNGGFRQAIATEVRDRLHARALVLDDGAGKAAIAVVDSCMMPRDLLDEVKRRAAERTGIPPGRMLVSATHTHTAPAVMGVHGTDPEPEYRDFLGERIVEAIAAAASRLAPARIGWGVGRCDEFVFCRRWIMKPGTARKEPFTGRDEDVAQMNPGHANENRVRSTGPVDPSVTVLSLETPEGKPLALLANYSTHYAGSSQVSADYFGEFARIVAERLEASDSPFVAMISNGTSGDANCIDFRLPERRPFTQVTVAEAVAGAALDARAAIEHVDWSPLDVVEDRLTLAVRMPAAEEVAAARAYLAEHVGDRPVKTVAENYARETVLLSAMPPTRELILQTLRIGEFSVAAIPCEVYGSTGLRIKERSPFETTMVVSLANGAEGYIPPPEQFELGGYTTWRARSSCLEVEAEPKITATVLRLLERLAR